MKTEIAIWLLISVVSIQSLNLYSQPKESSYSYNSLPNPILFQALRYLITFIGTSYLSYKLTPVFETIEDKLSYENKEHVVKVWNKEIKRPEVKIVYNQHLEKCPLCHEMQDFLEASLNDRIGNLDKRLNSINQTVSLNKKMVDQSLNQFNNRLETLEAKFEKHIEIKTLIIWNGAPYQSDNVQKIELILKEYGHNIDVKEVKTSGFRGGIYYSENARRELLLKLAQATGYDTKPYEQSGLLNLANYDVIFISN